MPAEELSRLIDQELGHQRRRPGAARPEPEALPGRRASSRSWVPRHLAAAMERDSGRRARRRQRPVRCCGTARPVSPVTVLGWVLVGVLVATYLFEGALLAPHTVGNYVAPPMARVVDLGRPAAPKPESSLSASTAKWGASIAAAAPRQGDDDWPRGTYSDTNTTKAEPGAHNEAKAEAEPGAHSEAEAKASPEAEDADHEEPPVPRGPEAAAKAASDPGIRTREAPQPEKGPKKAPEEAPAASLDYFPFIRLGDTNAALFNKSVGANADGKTLAFWHIPKTGGTYVENVLSAAGIKVGRELFTAADDNVNVRPVLPKGPKGWMSPWHMPLPWLLEYIEKWAEFYEPDGKKPTGQNWYATAKQADQGPAADNTLRWWLDLDNVDFFCVVRDPYQKLISEYKWFHSLFIGNRGHEFDCSPESLNRFLADQVPSGNFDNHMTPQVRYVFDSYDDQICKHVLHQENLEAELTALLLEYNLIDAAAAVAIHAEAQATGNWDQASQVAMNDMKSSSDCGIEPSMLTEETKRLVRERYREDFEAFGYDDLSEDDVVASNPARSEPAEDPPLQPGPGPLPAFWFSQEDGELANATAGAVPAAPGPSPCVPGAYAVLISGQVQRFVWKDEAGPLLAAADPACPPVVDVYIVLQQGELGRVWVGAVPDTPYQAETTAENLQDWYRTRGARHVLVELVSAADVRVYLDEAPFPDGKPWWRHSPESDSNGARYRNNLKMFYLRHLAFAAAAASGRLYDGFTYWREDNFFFTPLPEALIPSAGPKPEVAVDANCGWGSYSDKVYASNPTGAGVLFDLTQDDFRAKMADYAAYGAPGGEWQTEAFLTDVMAAAGVTVTKREFHRTDVRYVPGHDGICVPGLYWGCTLDGYLNTALNADHGLQCCGDAMCAIIPKWELMLAAQRDWQPDAAKTLAPYRARPRPRASLPCGSRMQDGQPFLFQSPAQPDHKAFVCLNEKAGSTTWKLALLRAGPHTEFHNLTVSPHGAPAEPNCGEHSEDVDVPRFMMVRNPYSRLLSGYIDTCVDARAAAVLPGNMGEICIANKDAKDPAAAFPAFVEAVINEDPGRLNGHFRFLSKHCHVDAGYDFYLPTEQIAHWYAPFVAALDLGEAVRTGWDVSTRWWHNDGSECFYHPPGLGCDGAPLGLVHAGAFSGDSLHATGSDGRLDEFYTPELARAVSEWAKADLEELGYPAWDGVDGAGYLRRISAPY